MRNLMVVLSVMALFVFALAQPKEPPKGAKCVVCGMDVNMMPKFTSQLKMKGGKHVYTESPKHAIQFYLKNGEKVSQIWVRDFSSGRWIDAKRAYYVAVDEGPMGPDIVAFRSLVKAKKFAKGKKVFRFKDIDAEFLKYLDMGHGGMKHGRHNMKHMH